MKFKLKLPSKRQREEAEEEEPRRFIVWSADLSGISVVKRYTVRGTRSEVVIGQAGGEYVYYVVDPPVDKSELLRLEKAVEETDEEIPMITPEVYFDQQKRRELEETINKFLDKRKVRDENVRYIIIREFLGYGPLDPAFKDPELENVECNGPGQPITVTHRELGRMRTNMVLDETQLQRLLQTWAVRAGAAVSEAVPMGRFMLPDGRLAYSYGYQVGRGTSFVLRRFPERPWVITAMLRNGTITPEVAAWLWMLAEFKLPILVVGEMGSGKTSLANALMGLIPPDRRIGTAEDIPEFKIPHKNWLRRITRQTATAEAGRPITLLDLIKQLLTENVDYIIVNEIRDAEEAKAWFQAVATGHGGITTFHAESLESVFGRLEGFGIQRSHLHALASAVFIYVLRVRGRRVRRIKAVYDVVDPLDRRYNTVFEHDVATDRIVQKTPLEKTRAAEVIRKLTGWEWETFLTEYKKRVEFLRLLTESGVEDPEELYRLLVDFYRGYMPALKRETKKAEQPAPPPQRKAPYVVRIGGRGTKRVVLELHGLSLVNSNVKLHTVGNTAEWEGDADVVEVGLEGAGVLKYKVFVKTAEGWKLARQGEQTLPTVAAREAENRTVRSQAGASPKEALLNEATVVAPADDDKTVVLTQETSAEAPEACLKMPNGVVVKISGEIVLGRDAVPVKEAHYISRRHARIYYDNGRWYVEDLGSTNGTWLNGRPIKGLGPQPLAHGDLINLATKAELQFFESC